MKELKAFIRSNRVEQVVRALEAAKAPGITLSRVHGVGYGYDPYTFTLAPSEVAKAPAIAKVEVVCSDECVERLIDALVGAAHTGLRGDGIVFVTNVEQAVRIRTVEKGDVALCDPPAHEAPSDPS